MDSNSHNDRLQLHILEHGFLDAEEMLFVTENGEEFMVTATWRDRCYLIEHPRGRLLWDSGLPEAESYRGDDWTTVTLPIRSWLAGLDLTPTDITYLGLSHLHFDHAGTANQFAASTVLISAREHAYAFDPDVRPSAYHMEDYAALRESPTVLIDEVHDVFGDGTVVVHAAPGHSVGHQMLMLMWPDRVPLLLVGDVWYSHEDRTRRRFPSWTFDRAEALRTMDHIENLVSQTGAHVYIHHDADAHV